MRGLIRALSFILLSACALVATRQATAEQSALKVDDVLKKENLLPRGETYQATVPDTLDLAELAKLSVGVLTESLDPEQYYGVWSIDFDPKVKRQGYGTWDIAPKNARTLSTLRVMCGSDLNLDREYGLMHAMMSAIDARNGLLYIPYDGPGAPRGTCYPQECAMLVLAMLNYHAMDGNPLWLKWIDHIVKGMRGVAIEVEDRAFYPMQSGIDRQGKWHIRQNQMEPPFFSEDPPPYDPTHEPQADALGYEGAARAETNRSLSVLAKHYAMTNDRESLQLAEKILRFNLKPAIWAQNADEAHFPGFEHGVWIGHFHNGTQGLNPFLDMALATNSPWLKGFTREYYEQIRQNGLVRMGWFPAWSAPEKCGRPVNLSDITETCSLGDFILDAVRLSDAGLGDYWDDVDYTVRNQLVEQQFQNLEAFRDFLKVAPGSKEEALLSKFVGAFYSCTPTHMAYNGFAPCCTANGAQGYYYAWEGITRFDKPSGIATVNLFLNRASEWMDIDSYLPYAGRVVLRNKQASAAHVRIPDWVDAEKIESRLTRDGKSAGELNPSRIGNRLIYLGLKPGDVIDVTFPVPVITDRYTIAGKKYELTFKGSTIIDVSPRPEGHFLQLYQRDAYRGDQAPMRAVNRFVAHRIIPPGSF